MNSDKNNIQDADELAALIDRLMENGTQHINLEIGEETEIRTLNSSDCGKKGACSIPTFNFNDTE